MNLCMQIVQARHSPPTHGCVCFKRYSAHARRAITLEPTICHTQLYSFALNLIRTIYIFRVCVPDGDGSACARIGQTRRRSAYLVRRPTVWRVQAGRGRGSRLCYGHVASLCELVILLFCLINFSFSFLLLSLILSFYWRATCSVRETIASMSIVLLLLPWRTVRTRAAVTRRLRLIIAMAVDTGTAG